MRILVFICPTQNTEHLWYLLALLPLIRWSCSYKKQNHISFFRPHSLVLCCRFPCFCSKETYLSITKVSKEAHMLEAVRSMRNFSGPKVSIYSSFKAYNLSLRKCVCCSWPNKTYRHLILWIDCKEAKLTGPSFFRRHCEKWQFLNPNFIYI